MNRTIRGCQVGALLAAVAVLVIYTHGTDPKRIATQIALVALIICTLLGVGPLIMRDLIWHAVRDELAAFRSQILEDFKRELDDATARARESLHQAREEGVREGALRAQLGRTNGDPPLPRRRPHLVEESPGA